MLKVRSVVQNIPRRFYSGLLVERRDDKAIVTLNRPKQLNAMNEELQAAMFDTFSELNQDTSVKLVLLKGNGPAFSAGGEIKELTQALHDGGNRAAKILKRFNQIIKIIHNFNKPFVPLVNGICMGGGAGLASMATRNVFTENATFAMPETSIGHFCDTASCYFLTQLKDGLGFYLALTGHRLKGAEIKKIGIASHFITSDLIVKFENELMSLTNASKESVDEVLNRHDEKSPSDVKFSFDYERAAKLFNANSIEEVFDNLGKDGSDWSKKRLELLKVKNPTSLKVTFELYKRTRDGKLSGDDALDLDHTILVNLYKSPDRVIDFKEGVRAILVDRDNKPNWNPKTIEEVDDSTINSFFEPLHRL